MHAAASGLSGNGKIDASVQSSMQALATAGNLTYDVTRKGPNESFPNPTVKDLIDYALNFPTKIQGHEWTIKYSTSDYSGIVDWPLMTPVQRQVSNKLAAYVRQLYYRRAGLKYINGNQKAFPPFDSGRLQNEIQGLDAEIQNVSELALGCISTGHCNEPQYRTIAPLPPRLDDAITIDPSRNEWKLIGAAIGSETKVVITEGMWYARCDNGKLLLPQQPGDSDSYRFVDIKTAAETFAKAAKPTLVPPNSYVYYKVFDGATDYFDNCSPNGLKVRIFQPLYADEYKPGTTLNAAALAQLANKLAASTTEVTRRSKAASKAKVAHVPKADISLPVR